MRFRARAEVKESELATTRVSTQQLLSQTGASREKIYIFPAASRTVVSHSGDVPSPETPWSMTLYR